jgi:YbgC/YbaW family acyl-CoA thioester hydrolase
LDQAKHVNNAVYLTYLEDLAVQMAVSSDWPPARMEAMGFTVLPYRYMLEYLQPAVLDDRLDLCCWVSNANDRTAVRHSTITQSSDGALVVRARTLWGCADPDTGQPLRMDEGFLADLQRDEHRADQHRANSHRAGAPLRRPATGAQNSA